ncbi:MAG: protein jag [Oscillospiraceae bacterium]|nr:protein jag [Oscillospiraceae bacterium]
MEELIFTGKTVEVAVENAAQALGKDKAKLRYEVLEEGKKGLFGSKDAKIKVLESSKVQRVKAFMEEIIKNFPLEEVEVTVTDDEQALKIELSGENASYLIGRRGDTLNALQYLAGLVANNGEEKYSRVSLNINGYREKREKTLEGLANRLGRQVLRSGRSVTLEPMAPYERRIIHATVQKIEGISSSSVGEEPNRKVVISSDNPRQRREGRRDNRRRGERTHSAPRHNEDSLIKDDFLTSSSTIEGLKKEKELREAAFPLYGKVDLD